MSHEEVYNQTAIVPLGHKAGKQPCDGTAHDRVGSKVRHRAKVSDCAERELADNHGAEAYALAVAGRIMKGNKATLECAAWVGRDKEETA